MSLDQLKEFLQEIKKNKKLYEKVSKVGTADDIALIAKSFGYEFTGTELKSIENKDLKKQMIRSATADAASLMITKVQSKLSLVNDN